MKKTWFSASYRRWLVDMHIPDWNEEFLSKINPDNYAEMMELAGVDTAIIYAASCLGICYWPTKSGYMHKQLKGRDILKEIIVACRKKNLNVVVYYNIWSRWAYDIHPEWRIVQPNGKGTVEDGERYGLCCPNTGFRDYVVAQLCELCEDYEFEGLWIDMIGWFSKICYCPACRARFLTETGKELPRTINWEDCEWVQFQRKREEWLAEFAELIYSTAKVAKPGVSVTLQHTSLIHGWAGGINYNFTLQSDYLAGDFGGDALDESVVCKLLNGLTQNKPVEFMMPCCEDLSHHTTDKPAEVLLMEAYAAIANQCCYVSISAINPNGTLNPRAYTIGEKNFSELKRYEEFLTPDAEICADIAIYWSFSSMINFVYNGSAVEDFNTDSTHYKDIKKIAGTLIAANLPFTIITQKDLQRLDDFRLVILSDVVAMDSVETKNFENFVKHGGKLYASGKTSLYNCLGEKQADFQLAKVFGVNYSGSDTLENITYIAPEDPPQIFWNNYSQESPLMLENEQVVVKADTQAEVLGTLVLPYGDFRELDHFGCANSNPPGIYTSHPALVRNRFGKGEVVYCAGPLEKQPYAKQREVFAGLITSLIDRQRWKSNAPASVETILFYDNRKNRLLINILNYQDVIPPIPVCNIKIKINVDNFIPGALFRAPDKQSVDYHLSDERSLEFNIPEVQMFSMYILEVERKK